MVVLTGFTVEVAGATVGSHSRDRPALINLMRGAPHRAPGRFEPQQDSAEWWLISLHTCLPASVLQGEAVLEEASGTPGQMAEAGVGHLDLSHGT
ncbi:hypothetical protein AAFF_G00049560 [Aldrovandia affinis]|uniref:Uncharacterized protein n=1 Tax=Aldrovandia affinis TaxID=143900 RepID=A0AAD7WEI8_9TELE|nr:hypothetical protein AAFF_G00049560 [Aldrovandia affinis]